MTEKKYGRIIEIRKTSCGGNSRRFNAEKRDKYRMLWPIILVWRVPNYPPVFKAPQRTTDIFPVYNRWIMAQPAIINGAIKKSVLKGRYVTSIS